MSCDRNSSRTDRASRTNGIPRLAGKSAGVALRMNPAVKREYSTGRDGRYTITPLPSGYGVTMGNALRRTLLSGLKGAAVTSVKVAGIDHEFSTIPHVREDVTTLILNMKQVRLKFKSDKPARLKLKVRGEGVVTAGDLVCPPHVKVVNPDLPLLTGDSAEARADLEFSADTGYGYSPSEDRLGLPIGEMPIDAVFSPVRQATFQVDKPGVAETARVGHSFDNLTVAIKTDGTTTPEAALREASARLAKRFVLVADEPWFEKKDLPATPYRRTLEQIDLQPRTRRALQKAGYSTVPEVLKSLRDGSVEIKGLKGMGKGSFDDLIDALKAQSLSDGDREVLKIITMKGRKK